MVFPLKNVFGGDAESIKHVLSEVQIKENDRTVSLVGEENGFSVYHTGYAKKTGQTKQLGIMNEPAHLPCGRVGVCVSQCGLMIYCTAQP